MYCDFYDLEEKPFTLVPDPRFLYLSPSHREALAHLLYGIHEGEGFMVVVGPVGSGKTTLCRTLLERVSGDAEVGFIFNPSSSAAELLATINKEFGIPAEASTASELTAELNEFLLAQRVAGRRVLLVIDEAQNLGASVLEQVRLLSNLETERCKLLQILLFGQPELDGLLDRSDLRQLRQRITVRWALRPLSLPDTRLYVEHRLRVAGGKRRDLFSLGALERIYRASGGIPRLINAVADRALLAGYSAGLSRVDARTVIRAARELPGTRRGPARWPIWAPVSALLGAGLGIALLLAAPWVDQRLLASVEAAPRPGLVAEPGDLESALEMQTGGSSAARALDVVLTEWGYAPLGVGELLPEHFASVVADRTDLLVLDTWSDLDRLGRMNLPAVLEVRPAEGLRRYVALVRAHPDGSLVVRDGSRSFWLSAGQLDELWTGRTLVPWMNFEFVPALHLGMEGPAVVWLQGRLAGLGYLSADAESGQFDEPTLDAVRQLQAVQTLEPSGEVGPATLIALYRALQYHTPMLAIASPVGEVP
ncbi:MAG: AAA family ATPase [Myxococcota bacterium]